MQAKDMMCTSGPSVDRLSDSSCRRAQTCSSQLSALTPQLLQARSSLSWPSNSGCRRTYTCPHQLCLSPNLLWAASAQQVSPLTQVNNAKQLNQTPRATAQHSTEQTTQVPLPAVGVGLQQGQLPASKGAMSHRLFALTTKKFSVPESAGGCK